MEIGTLIIGGLFIVITAIFFLSVNRAKRNRDRAVLTKALSMAGLEPGGVGPYAMGGNMVLAWLSGEQELFYYRKARSAENASRIRLQDIREAKVEKEVRSRPSSMGHYSFVQAVHIRLSPSQPGKGDTLLSLYNQDEDGQLGSELEIAQDWANQINKRLIRP